MMLLLCAALKISVESSAMACPASRYPSATEKGPPPAATGEPAAEKCPAPSPQSTLTLLLVLLAVTMSSQPSPFTSASAIDAIPVPPAPMGEEAAVNPP